MALHTQPEFAKLCGIPLANLSTYKSRGKILLSDNRVDDALQINADFLKKMLSKKGKLSDETPAVIQSTDIKDTTSDEIIKAKRNKSTASSGEGDSAGSLFQLEKQKKALDIEKTAEEIELLKKKNEKLEGELLPTVLVKSLIKLHFTSATNQFKNVIENTLSSWSKKKDFSREEIADIRNELTKLMNDAVVQSIKESQKNLNQIITDYTVKRNVGERQ